MTAASGARGAPGTGGADDARIIDRGYRRYDGARLGAAGAQRALYRATLQRALGLRRKFRFKIPPILVIVLSHLPAVAFVGVSALLPNEVSRGLVPRYGDYYSWVNALILLFVAIVVPNLLCSDRRSGMLGLYLAAPLTRDSYLGAKVAAILTVVTSVTLAPPLLLLIGYSSLDVGPSWPLEGIKVILRVLLAGLSVAAWFSMIAVVAASLTDRPSIASVAAVLAALVTGIVASILDDTGASSWVRLGDLYNLPYEVVRRIYGEPGSYPAISTVALFASFVGTILAGAVFVRFRYRRLAVTK